MIAYPCTCIIIYMYIYVTLYFSYHELKQNVFICIYNLFFIFCIYIHVYIHIYVTMTIHTHLCDNDNDKAIIMIMTDANPKSSARKKKCPRNLSLWLQASTAVVGAAAPSKDVQKAPFIVGHFWGSELFCGSCHQGMSLLSKPSRYE